MPELPEVESVRRELSKVVIGRVFDKPVLFYPPMLKTDPDTFFSSLPGRKILSLSRKGKFLLFHLEGNTKIVFHLRMEGKLFLVDKKKHEERHMTLFLPFQDDMALAFYDVRKFGTCHFLPEEEEGPLQNLGKEPFEMEDGKELFEKIRHSRKPIKSLLMDQKILAGLGNIYADEVLFASCLSPFMEGRKVPRKTCDRLIHESKRILSLAIQNNGSTIRTYKASESVHGNMQDFLKVYGRAGKICPSCHQMKIEKKKIENRGTCYCPKCQKTGIAIAVTGKIGAGKSLVCQDFKKFGYLSFSCDEEVHLLYEDKTFLSALEKRFPEVFTPQLDKEKISALLVEDKKFNRDYTRFLFSSVRERMLSFLADNDGKDKTVEVPLLFDAHWEKDFTFLLGVETTNQLKHLKERGDKDPEKRITFNKVNSYDRNRHKLDFIIHTDSSKRHLMEEVRKVDEKIKSILEKEKNGVCP